MREVDFNEKRTFKDWFHKNQVGVYVTILFHLVVLLLLTLNEIRMQLNAPMTEVHLLQQTDVPDKVLTEEEKAAALEKEVEEMLNAASVSRPSISLPNITVNAGAGKEGNEQGGSGEGAQKGMSLFSDNRSKPLPKPEILTEQQKVPSDEGDVIKDEPRSEESSDTRYQGPSVISYVLDGRSAMYMPVPAYMCRAGGDVTVTIEVNKLGYVVSVEIDRKTSSKDECLQDAAKTAASTARFTTSPTGVTSQKGNIVYRFMPQNR